jgi:hypothetical protein
MSEREREEVLNGKGHEKTGRDGLAAYGRLLISPTGASGHHRYQLWR